LIRISETLPAALAGERIDRVVAMLTACSRSEATELLAAGVVQIDGSVITTRSTRVAEGEVVVVDLADADDGPVVVPDPAVPVTVVHEDDEVIVVDKQAGLVVHPGSGNADGTLVHGLLALYPEIAAVGEAERPGIVHRIDKGTSGLLVVARTERARESLVAQMSSRSVEREYRVLVWGTPSPAQGVVDAAIGRSGRDPTRMVVSERGREARTRFEVVEGFSEPVDVALLGCRLETGRTHQIRVHLSAIGHPVVGDGRYSGDRTSLPCPRPFLHAAKLGFEHPTSGERLHFESALPADLVQVLDGLS
jgi:23S rRNA pseudouridine1911/1915/1917 synthase